MSLIRFDGGPLLGIDRTSLSQWGGVFHKSFFGDGSAFENDYEEMCERLDRKKSTNISSVKGTRAEAILIEIPLPTLVVEAGGASIHIVQILSSEQGWSDADLTMDDFQNATGWGESVQFFCTGGEFIIFDSSCSYEDIDDHFNLSLEKGLYRCDSCHQKRKGQAEIVLIRMLKQV